MPANFDPVARLYRYLEYASFGPALWHRRIAYLPQLSAARRVLMAGEGDGRFLAAFLEANAHATVDYFDASPRMLALARQRALPHAARIQFFVADLLATPLLPSTYDTLITHFFLDCFSDAELAHLVPQLARAATPHATWIVSEFQGNSPLVRGLYAFFGLTTGVKTRRLPNHHQALANAGFQLAEAQTAWRGLLTSERWTPLDLAPHSYRPRL